MTVVRGLYRLTQVEEDQYVFRFTKEIRHGAYFNYVKSCRARFQLFNRLRRLFGLAMEVRYATSCIGRNRTIRHFPFIRTLRVSVVGAVLHIRRIGRSFFSKLGRRCATIRVDLFIRIMSGPIGGHAGRVAFTGLGGSFQASHFLYNLFIWYFRVVSLVAGLLSFQPFNYVLPFGG